MIDKLQFVFAHLTPFQAWGLLSFFVLGLFRAFNLSSVKLRALQAEEVQLRRQILLKKAAVIAGPEIAAEVGELDLESEFLLAPARSHGGSFAEQLKKASDRHPRLRSVSDVSPTFSYMLPGSWARPSEVAQSSSEDSAIPAPGRGVITGRGARGRDDSNDGETGVDALKRLAEHLAELESKGQLDEYSMRQILREL